MRFLSQIGLGLTALAMALMPLTLALALPIFDWGIFRQVATVTVGLHVLSAVAALGLMLVSVGAPARLSGTLTAPVLALLALSAVGAVAMVAADDPLRSLNGTLEHGIGVVWFAELALAVTAATVLRREAPRAYWAAVGVGVASAVACIALTSLDIPYGKELLVPYDFPGYLGPICLLAAVPLLALRDRRWLAAAVVLAVVGVLVSENRGAMLALPFAVALWALARAVPAHRRNLALGAAAVALPLALTAGIYLSGPMIQGWYQDTRPDAGSEAVASAAPIDRHALQEKPVGTLWARSVTTRLSLASVASQPVRILAGRGFGSFETVAVEGSRDVPGRRFVAATPTASRLYWDGDQKAKFHSHNLLIEAVLSAGVLAGVAWLGFAYALGRSASSRAASALLIATLCVAGSFWFLVNAALPLLALAVAAVVPPLRLPRRAAPGGLALAAMPVLALAMVGTAGLAAVTSASARGERMERGFFPLIAGPGGPACIGFHADLMPDRQINVNLYRMFVRNVEDKGAGAMTELLPRMSNAANFSCLMRTYVMESSDVEAMEASLRARSRLDIVLGRGNPVMERLLGPDFNLWIDDIERMLDRAPGRTDVIMPFLDWTARNNRPDRIAAAARLLPRLAETDPIRHYFLAVQAAGANDADARGRHMAEALRLGLANVVPIPAETIKAMTGASVR